MTKSSSSWRRKGTPACFSGAPASRRIQRRDTRGIGKPAVAEEPYWPLHERARSQAGSTQRRVQSRSRSVAPGQGSTTPRAQEDPEDRQHNGRTGSHSLSATACSASVEREDQDRTPTSRRPSSRGYLGYVRARFRHTQRSGAHDDRQRHPTPGADLWCSARTATRDHRSPRRGCDRSSVKCVGEMSSGSLCPPGGELRLPA